MELLATGGTCFLIKVPGCTLHFVNLSLEVVNVVQVFVELFVGSLDRVLLILQVLEQELSEDAEFEFGIFLQNLEDEKG